MQPHVSLSRRLLASVLNLRPPGPPARHPEPIGLSGPARHPWHAQPCARPSSRCELRPAGAHWPGCYLASLPHPPVSPVGRAHASRRTVCLRKSIRLRARRCPTARVPPLLGLGLALALNPAARAGGGLPSGCRSLPTLLEALRREKNLWNTCYASDVFLDGRIAGLTGNAFGTLPRAIYNLVPARKTGIHRNASKGSDLCKGGE